MTQLDLLLPRDTHCLEPSEVRRLAGQSLRILAELKRGPMTRDEIAAIGRNVTARVSDLRKAGYDVRCIEQNRRTGFTRYALIEGENLAESR
jgi:hypothetical protein